MGKTFAEGVDELKNMVGSGTLEGKISVNQVYAHWIDDGVSPHGKPAIAFDHPRGGEAMYLSGPVRYRRGEVFQRWANSILRGRLIPETVDILRSFKDDVSLNAPREFDILRNSTALRLTDDNEPIFDLPALIPRLSETEIKAIRKSSTSGGGSNIGWRVRRAR